MSLLRKLGCKALIAVASLRGDVAEASKHRKTRRPALPLLIAVVLAGLLLVVANPNAVLSQGVRLIKVDVEVVAKGHRVSKLLGNSVTNEKNEKVGTLDDLIVDQDRTLFAVLQ